MDSDKCVFKIEQAYPMKNVIMIRGYWQVRIDEFQIKTGEQLQMQKDGKRIGVLRLLGFHGANFLWSAENPPYLLSVAVDNSIDYRTLIGTELYPILNSFEGNNL